MILKEPRQSAGPRAGGDIQEEAPGPTEKPEARPPSPRGPMAGPTMTSGAGKPFTVSVYKLPADIKALPDFSALRPANTISADQINLNPAKGENEPSGITETDGLGLRAIGLFRVVGEGIFKWRVNSKDGARLSIDDKTVVENDGLHEASSKTGYTQLGEGVHTIILDSFNSKGSPVLKLSVEPPTGPEHLFSGSQGVAGWKEPAKPYDALWGQVYFVPKGNYPNGPDFGQLTSIGRVIAPTLDLSGGDEIPGIPGRKDNIGIRYQGFFNVTGAGIFAFRMATDNFGRLTIGKQAVVENPGGAKPSPEGRVGWAFLQAGSYPISVDYFHGQGPTQLELFVTSPIKDEEVFAPAKTLDGFASDSGQLSLVPAFVYFVKPDTKVLPNYNKMSPAGMFFSKAIDYAADRGTKEFPGVPKRDKWLGLRFYVKFSLAEQEAGQYKFRLVSTDATRLIIGKKSVIFSNGAATKITNLTGEINLGAGSHEMFLDYLQTNGPSALQLFITPPGGQEKVFAFQ
jgi:hypothetical protein